MSTVAGELIVSSGLIAPESSAAVAVTSLKVEPGGYWPWVTRFSIGEPGS